MPGMKLGVAENSTEDIVDNLFVNPDDIHGDVNRIGEVPLWWYEGMEHIGYGVDGTPIEQKIPLTGNEIDLLLAKNRNKESSWRDIVDVKNQTVTRLSDTDLLILERMRSGKMGVQDSDPNEFYHEFDFADGIFQLSNRLPAKAQFLPSKSDQKKVDRIIGLIRAGKVYKKQPPKIPQPHDIWGSDIEGAKINSENNSQSKLPSLPAPKMALPSNAESYNPKPKCLFTPEEEKEWHESLPEDRQFSFIPKKYSCLRHVPAFQNLIRERFLRCLDLYLCPRLIKTIPVSDPRTLIPQLPSLNTLKPFPQKIKLQLQTSGPASGLCLSLDSQLLFTGCKNGSFFGFNVGTHPMGRPIFSLKSSKKEGVAIHAVSHHPFLPIIAIARGACVYIMVYRSPSSSPNSLSLDTLNALAVLGINNRQVNSVLDFKNVEISQKHLDQNNPQQCGVPKHLDWLMFYSHHFECQLDDENERDKKKNKIENKNEDDDEEEIDPEDADYQELMSRDWINQLKMIQKMKNSNWIVGGYVIRHGACVTQMDFQKKGNYLVVVTDHKYSPSLQCTIHCLSKLKTYIPFRKTHSARVTGAYFHPIDPHLCVCFQDSIRFYNLAAQSDNQTPMNRHCVRRLVGSTRLSQIGLHKNGELVVAGSHHGRVSVFDYSYKQRPLKIFRAHEGDVRQVSFHDHYPLFASAATDGIYLMHFASSDADFGDFQITPVRRLLSTSSNRFNSLLWHRKQPWLFSTAESDNHVNLWV